MEQLGGKLTDELKEQYAKSPNWKDGKFVNLVETRTAVDFLSLPKMLYKTIVKAKERTPEKKIDIRAFNDADFKNCGDTANIVWYGHSAVLINMNGTTILIDPMLGPDASPIAPFRTLRFTSDTLPLLEELPEIDLVLISHDHYDHLDMDSIKKLKGCADHFFVALGVKRHLVAWGIDENIITEFDWWDDNKFNDLNITFTPSRHFSGRGLTDKQTSMWGGWVLANDKERIYFSGDGGYGEHFKEVGEKLGPFDFGLIECGQYDDLWEDVHMTPEESVQAALDSKMKVAMPIHWGAFSLSHHPWKDPIRRFLKQAKDRSLKTCHSEPGAIFCCSNEQWPEWWENYD